MNIKIIKMRPIILSFVLSRALSPASGKEFLAGELREFFSIFIGA
jgi:hypothetical protein